MATLSIRGQWARQLIRDAVTQDLIEQQQQQRSDAPAGFVGAPQDGLRPMPAVGLLPSTKLPLDPRPRRTTASTSNDGNNNDIGSTTTFSVRTTAASTHSLELEKSPSLPENAKVCIIGAGVAGLYIAMILDDLAIPNLSYEILEASDRVGGRIYTHWFSKEETGSHDYYDIGAMRYPKLDIMKRTFDLFEHRLGFSETDPKKKLLKYILDSDSGSVFTPQRYNDIVVVDGIPPPDPEDKDPFCVSRSKDGSVPDKDITLGMKGLLDSVFEEFRDALKADFKKGFEKLLEYDGLSTRQYIATVKKYDYYTIQWMETNNTSSGLFDQAFTESVMDSFDFTASDWMCIEGGTGRVIEEMLAKIQQKPKKSHRVTKVGQNMDIDVEGSLYVEVAGEQTRDNLCTVFNTTSLGCLQRVDLADLDLHPSQKDAIRCLHYDDSCKIAIKFSYPWWITECGIKTGGTGNSDLPLRTCVYPSYNINDPLNKPSILLCSYTWAQDATRIGSLIGNDAKEAQLMELMYDNLAKLHLENFQKKSDKAKTLQEVRDLIKDAYITHNAFSWSQDPYTSGAFALFGPGQFSKLYPYLNRPAAGGKFHIVGEAASAHHAWIVGALDSAYAAVHKFLNTYSLWDAMDKLEKNWGNEFGKVADVEDGPGKTRSDFGTEWLQLLLSGAFGKVEV